MRDFTQREVRGYIDPIQKAFLDLAGDQATTEHDQDRGVTYISYRLGTLATANGSVGRLAGFPEHDEFDQTGKAGEEHRMLDPNDVRALSIGTGGRPARGLMLAASKCGLVIAQMDLSKPSGSYFADKYGQVKVRYGMTILTGASRDRIVESNTSELVRTSLQGSVVSKPDESDFVDKEWSTSKLLEGSKVSQEILRFLPKLFKWADRVPVPSLAPAVNQDAT